MTVEASAGPAKVAVVTGNHPFDVPGFHALFRAMGGVDAYVQDLENFVHDWGQMRASYDALVFYNMHMDSPPSELAQAMINGLGSASQGIVVLHHAILAWPGSPEWESLTGIEGRSFGYHMGQEVRIEVANSEHPITQGLSDFDLQDETYTMADICLLSTVDFATWIGLPMEAEFANLKAWHDRVTARPSSQA